MKKITYKKSGVDIDQANIFVDKIKALLRKTRRKEVFSSIGGFSGLFRFLKNKYKEPILVASSDGVGTKLMIAKDLNIHTTVGIDLVAMNVNDILCIGAEPLFFLDYIACGKLKAYVLVDVTKGITDGCIQAGCALIGGETAEMPGMYDKDEYDLAGFTVGVIDKDKIIDGSKIRLADKVIGLQSNGLHSNGFSLVRKVFSKSEIRRNGQEILRPTRIYVKPVLALLKKINVKGIAHVTGGAYYEKIPRIIPKGLAIDIEKGSWPIQKIFKMVQRKGNVDEYEMFRTFNMGIGMVLVVSPKDILKARRILSGYKLKSWVIGEVVKGDRKVTIK